MARAAGTNGGTLRGQRQKDGRTIVADSNTTIQTWRAALTAVVEACQAERDASERAPEAIDVGPATLDPTRSGPTTSAFTVDTGNLRLGQRLLTRLVVSSPVEGATQYPVVEVGAWDAATFQVEADLDPLERMAAGVNAEGTGLRLYAMVNHAYVSHILAERIEQLAEPGLIAGLLLAAPNDQGDAAPLPPDVGVICGNEERRRSTVISAVEQLANAGRSVLVVSEDNLALDTTLLAVARAIGQTPPGRFLRVGIATTSVVADDSRLAYAGVLARLSPHLQGQLADISAELRNLAASAALPGVAELPAPTSVFEPVSVVVEPDQIALRERLQAAVSTLAAADTQAEHSAAEAEMASGEHAAARHAWRELDGARSLHNRIDGLARQVEEASTASAASAVGVGRLANDDSRAHQLVVAAEVAANRLTLRDDALQELTKAQDEARRVGTTRLHVIAADQALAKARTRHAEAERESLRARAEAARAAAELGRLEGLGEVSPVDLAGLVGRDSGSRRAAETRVAVSGLALTRAADPATVARRAELRAQYTSLRNDQTARGPIAIENAQAGRLAGQSGQALELGEGDPAQVEGSLGSLGKADDDESQPVLAGLIVLLHQAPHLQRGQQPRCGRLVEP